MKTIIIRQNTVFTLLVLVLLLAGLNGNAQQKEKPITRLVYNSLAGQTAPVYDLFEPGQRAGYKEADEYIREYVPLELEEGELNRLMEEKPAHVQMQFSVDGTTTLTVVLVKYSPLGSGFTVGTLEGRHEERIVSYEPGLYYRGIVENDPHSIVAFSFFREDVQGLIMTQAGNWVLSRLPSDEGNSNAYVLYNDSRENLLEEYGFTCETEDDMANGSREKEETRGERSMAEKECVQVYFEASYGLYIAQGNNVNNAASFITGFFNAVSTLYYNESIETRISEIRLWTVINSYSTSSSGAMLADFSAAMQNYSYTGDLALYITSTIFSLGGRAYGLNKLCDPPHERTAVQDIDWSYNSFPAYSWTVNAVTHEMGHLLGSPHTHGCYWYGSSTQIDDCGNQYAFQNGGFIEGFSCFNTSSPIIPSAGTIMSYCHLINTIDFTQGFGPQPGDRIRDHVYNAPCIHVCCDHNNDLVLWGTTNTPVTHYVSDEIFSTQHVSGAIPSPGIHYRATQTIYLNPGFEADEGLFTAYIVPCNQAGDIIIHTVNKDDGKEFGLLDDAGPAEVSIVPNPTSGMFSLKISPARQVSGMIYDVRGKQVMPVMATEQGLAEIDMTSAPPGIYFIRFVLDGQAFTSKLVKL